MSFLIEEGIKPLVEAINQHIKAGAFLAKVVNLIANLLKVAFCGFGFATNTGKALFNGRKRALRLVLALKYDRNGLVYVSHAALPLPLLACNRPPTMLVLRP